MKFKQILEELKSKNTWEGITPNEYSNELIKLVQEAYKKAPLGSFINSSKDLAGSDWIAIDLDDDPDIDATVFYRNSKSDEPFSNKKIQGMGHDGSKNAITIVLNKLKSMLSSGEYWVEASDKLEDILYKLDAPFVKNQITARRLFPKKKLNFIKETGSSFSGRYTRTTSDKTITETIFGKPKFK